MALYQKIDNPSEGTMVQFVGVYALRWKQEWGEPSVAFIETEGNPEKIAEIERIRITAFLSYDTTYSDDFCVRCSHCLTNCECEFPVYMTGWEPSKELRELKVQLHPFHQSRMPKRFGTNIKPFDQVKPGDVGLDFGNDSGTVIKTGTYYELKNYDSTGACNDMRGLDAEHMVAVKSEDNEELLYVYGVDGFAVYI